MKPIVIYAESKEKITLTHKEFEKYLSEAFDAGYAEGYNKGMSHIWYPYTPITYTTNKSLTTDLPYPNDDNWTITMTGEATNTIGD